MPLWKLASLAQKNLSTLHFKIFDVFLAYKKDDLFKSIYIWPHYRYCYCVALVEHLRVLHYSVEFMFLSFGIMTAIAELWNHQRVTDDA